MPVLADDGGGGRLGCGLIGGHGARGPSGGEHAASDQQAHQERPDEDHDHGHEQEDQLLPAQLDFAKRIVLG